MITIGNVEHKCANCVNWGCSFYTPFDHCMLHEGYYTRDDCCDNFTKRRPVMNELEITPELNLKSIIDETREVAQAMNEFANDLERIEKKYQEKMHELDKRKKELENQLNMSVQKVIEEDKE